MAKTKTTPRRSDDKGHLPKQQKEESIGGTAAKTSYKDPPPLLSPGQAGHLAIHITLVSTCICLMSRRVKINCTDCNIFYGMYVEGVKGITL